MAYKKNKIKNSFIEKLLDTKIINKLKNLIDPLRYKHSLNVAKIAVSLAVRFHLNLRKVALAGILHDCAKSLNNNLLKKYVYSLKADEIIKKYPSVWHSIAGYLYVQKKFKIKDREILDAIKYHTVGSEKMKRLAMIIYVADFVAHDRKDKATRNILKIITNKNMSIDNLVLLVLKEKLKYLIINNRQIHPDSIKLLNLLSKK